MGDKNRHIKYSIYTVVLHFQTCSWLCPFYNDHTKEFDSRKTALTKRRGSTLLYVFLFRYVGFPVSVIPYCKRRECVGGVGGGGGRVFPLYPNDMSQNENCIQKRLL